VAATSSPGALPDWRSVPPTIAADDLAHGNGNASASSVDNIMDRVAPVVAFSRLELGVCA